MSRWAILWDVTHGRDKPVGIAFDQSDGVRVIAPPSYCIPSRFTGEYRVLQPDGSLLMYGPGREGYFDQVLVELSRRMAVGKQDVSADLDMETLVDIYRTEVLEPAHRSASGEYAGRHGEASGHGAEPRSPYRHGAQRPRRRRVVQGHLPTAA